MPRLKICKEESCHNLQTTSGYCRLHYLKHWKRLKKEAHERATKRLNRYIESVIEKHPKKYIEVIKEDLRSSNFPKDSDPYASELDEIYHLFSESTYEEDIERLIQDLKIEKNF